MTTHEVRTPDGRTLAVLEAGEPDGPAVVAHHGSPGAGRLFRTEVESAQERGLRLITYDRPGFGGSSPHEGRTVADAALDVAILLDALGVESFVTYGSSGGGPHALACAALLGDRCAAAATLAGVGAADAPDLDWLEGMGEGNHAEFGAAREGRERLTPFLEAERAGIIDIAPEQLAESIRPHLSDVDAEALTGEFAEFLLGSFRTGLALGVEGWVEDDLAFLGPWGFDLASIDVPVLVLQGREDLMVPPAHGDWLRRHLHTAEGEVLAAEGHLTLYVNRVGDVHAWLAERL
jgi:pimeloyl-ACP methyl ester carboxylesterase